MDDVGAVVHLGYDVGELKLEDWRQRDSGPLSRSPSHVASLTEIEYEIFEVVVIEA